MSSNNSTSLGLSHSEVPDLSPSNNCADVPDVAQRIEELNGRESGSVCPYQLVETITEDHGRDIYSVKFCPFVSDHELFATVAGRQVTVYNCEDAKMVPCATFVDDCATEEYYAVDWALAKVEEEDKIILLFGGKNAIIRAIDPMKGTSYCTMIHGDAINEIACHPNNSSIFATASKDLAIRIFHVFNPTPIAILGGLNGHRDQVLTLDFDYTGKFIVSGSMDRSMMVWNIGKHKEIQKRFMKTAIKKNAVPKEPVELQFPDARSNFLHKNNVDCVKTMKSYIFSKSCENSIVLSKFGEFSDPSIAGRSCGRAETFSQTLAELSLPRSALWFNRFGVTTGPAGSSWIACGNTIGAVHLWDLHCVPIPSASNFVIKNKEFPKVIRRVEFSPSGKILIAVGNQGKVSRCNKTISGS